MSVERTERDRGAQGAAAAERDVLLSVQHLKKYFNVGRKSVLKAVDDVSFDIYRGETLGMVGESGCGKTTCGRTCIGLYPKTDGMVLYKGRDVHALTGHDRQTFKKEVQMVFQDPYGSLDPRMTVADIVAEGLDINHMCSSKEERQERVYESLEMVGLNREHANRFVHEFSGGQRQRIGIARALAVRPEFLVLDEPISALDVSIQAQVVNLLIDLQRKMGLTYLFVAHDLSMVKHISDRVAVLYLGTLVELATSEELFANPLHPYTQALLSAIPIPDPEVEREREATKIKLEGEVPSPINPAPGCRFKGRCRLCTDACDERPQLVEVSPGHFVACHRVAAGAGDGRPLGAGSVPAGAGVAAGAGDGAVPAPEAAPAGKSVYAPEAAASGESDPAPEAAPFEETA